MGRIIEIITAKRLVVILLIALLLIYLFTSNHNQNDTYYYTNTLNNSTFYVSGVDLINFYIDSLNSRYAEHPWVIRVSDFIIFFSLLLIFLFIVLIMVHMYKEYRFKKYYLTIYQTYYQKLKEVCSLEQTLTRNQMKEMLHHYSISRLSDWQINGWMKLLMSVRLECKESYRASNMFEAIHSMDMTAYITQTLEGRSSHKQIHLLQFLIVLKVFISNSQLLRLKSSKDRSLRRLTYIYCMMTNVDDPYTELIYSSNVEHLTLWDRMELHAFFGFLKEEQRRMPSFRAILENNQYTAVDPFFIREAAYWGDDEDMNHVVTYFQSPLVRCKEAAFYSVAIRRFIGAEEEVMRLYEHQPEVLRRIMLLSLLAMHSGKATQFFIDAYKHAASEQTKRVVLFCLKNYIREDESPFYALKYEAKEDELFNFEHVENQLISTHFLNELI